MQPSCMTEWCVEVGVSTDERELLPATLPKISQILCNSGSPNVADMQEFPESSESLADFEPRNRR